MPFCISSKHFTEAFHNYFGFGQKQPEFIHVQYNVRKSNNPFGFNDLRVTRIFCHVLCTKQL